MFKKVRIKSVPKARTGYQVKGALVNDVPAFGGADYNAYIGEKPSEVKKTISAVPRHMANLEAEGGETVIGNIDGSMMPSFFTITGPRHSNGGVPLNLPDDSFIFSDTKSMKITDPNILKMFNAKPKKGGYTPADLSKKYDLNKYRKILQDPNSDKMDRKTAEMMIKNYTMKLGALALAQESKKGFPQGIPELAKPYMEANGIMEQDILPEIPQPIMQQGMMQEQMPQEVPTEMPNGEPIAQPQSMEQDMQEQQMMMEQQPPMAYGGIPFAAYGMQIGGYDFPYYQDGGEYVIVNGKKVPANKTNKLEGEGTRMKTESGKDAIYRKQVAAERKEVLGKAKPGSGKKPNSSWDTAICEALKSGQTVQSLAQKGHGTVAGLTARFADCIKAAEEKFVEKEEAYFVDTPSAECPCLDDNGAAIPGKFAQKDPTTGECKPETCKPIERCECTRADGTTYDPGMDENGNCYDCEEPGEAEQTDYQLPGQEEREPEWWLQDTVNTMGAFGDAMSLKKYMPWEARVDLEEPRPTFLDPTRELAAQSEQANIAAQAASSFAGPQALNARLSQIQGQGAAQAANTLSNINNQNVNIGNQFEGQQIGVRNQEGMLNQQMANRLYDKNVVANQQFDNSKRQAALNMRQAYNNAVTNRWKTDALNQMYPNYQTLPGVGGRVAFTPTDKEVNPGAKVSTLGEQLKELMSQGFSRKEAEKYVLNQKKKGGSAPGYIYTDWPIFL